MSCILNYTVQEMQVRHFKHLKGPPNGPPRWTTKWTTDWPTGKTVGWSTVDESPGEPCTAELDGSQEWYVYLNSLDHRLAHQEDSGQDVVKWTTKGTTEWTTEWTTRISGFGPPMSAQDGPWHDHSPLKR